MCLVTFARSLTRKSRKQEEEPQVIVALRLFTIGWETTTTVFEELKYTYFDFPDDLDTASEYTLSVFYHYFFDSGDSMCSQAAAQLGITTMMITFKKKVQQSIRSNWKVNFVNTSISTSDNYDSRWSCPIGMRRTIKNNPNISAER